MRRLSLNRSEPAKKSGQNIPKNRCRTTIAAADSGNASGTALYRGSGRLLKPRPGARPGVKSRGPTPADRYQSRQEALPEDGDVGTSVRGANRLAASGHRVDDE